MSSVRSRLIRCQHVSPTAQLRQRHLRTGRQPRRALAVLAEPVRAESRALLAKNWASLPQHLRTKEQMLGVQGNGCGATIGAMPRCDFACRGCYLGEAANRIPAEPVEAIMAQMDALRPILGPDGNLQLTDGEVTLRPPEEVIALLQHAHSLELVPMLMTHGDSFRRRPGLLERFLTEGELVEVSIHVDTTQRGRVGAEYKNATTEAAAQSVAGRVRDAARCRSSRHRPNVACGDDDDRHARQPRWCRRT